MFDDGAARAVLRQAARGVRRRQAAQAALAGALPQAWLRAVDVEMPDRATLILRVSDALVGERLRRQSVRLRRELAGRLAGLRRLMVTDCQETS